MASVIVQQFIKCIKKSRPIPGILPNVFWYINVDERMVFGETVTFLLITLLTDVYFNDVYVSVQIWD